MPIQKVGVIGCGLMGSGIAQVCAQKGHATIVREVNDEVLKRGLDRIRGFLAEGVKRGKVTQAQMDQTLANLAITTLFEGNLTVFAGGGGSTNFIVDLMALVG